jgi:hypothetical protein
MAVIKRGIVAQLLQPGAAFLAVVADEEGELVAAHAHRARRAFLA